MEKIIYFPVKGGKIVQKNGSEYNVTHIKVRLYYSKGGYNYATSRIEKRGWYVSFTPVKKDEYFESTILGSGAKDCIVECDRRTKKNEVEALKIFNAEYTTGILKMIFPMSIDKIDMDNTIVVTE